MALQQIRKKRNGKEVDLTIGTDPADNNSRIFERSVLPDPDSQQYVREFPDEIHLKFDRSAGNGALVSIHNIWQQAEENNAGALIPGTYKEKAFDTSQADRLQFIQRFVAILYSMANGKSYGIDGRADMPVFDAAGNVMESTYTEEQKNAPGIFQGPGSYGYIEPVADEPVAG